MDISSFISKTSVSESVCAVGIVICIAAYLAILLSKNKYKYLYSILCAMACFGCMTAFLCFQNKQLDKNAAKLVSQIEQETSIKISKSYFKPMLYSLDHGGKMSKVTALGSSIKDPRKLYIIQCTTEEDHVLHMYKSLTEDQEDLLAVSIN